MGLGNPHLKPNSGSESTPSLQMGFDCLKIEILNRKIGFVCVNNLNLNLARKKSDFFLLLCLKRKLTKPYYAFFKQKKSPNK